MPGLIMDNAIWDRRPLSPTFLVNFVSSCKLRVSVPQKVLNLAQKFVTQCHSDCIETYFVAHYQHVESSVIRLVVDRIERPGVISGKPKYLAEEIIIPVQLLNNIRGSDISKQKPDGSVQSLWKALTEMPPAVDLSKLIVLRSWMSFCRGDDSKRSVILNQYQDPSSFFIEAISVDCPLLFTPIRPVGFIGSSLAKSLETSSSPPFAYLGSDCTFSSSWGSRFGYISVTDSGRFAVILNSDPDLNSSVLAGLWVSGISSISDPRVWILCMRFILYKYFTRRLIGSSTPYLAPTSGNVFPGVSMLLAFYGSTTGPPNFYEVEWGCSFNDRTPTKYHASTVSFRSHQGLSRLMHFDVFSASFDPTTLKPRSENGLDMFTVELHQPLDDQNQRVSALQTAVHNLFPAEAIEQAKTKKQSVRWDPELSLIKLSVSECAEIDVPKAPPTLNCSEDAEVTVDGPNVPEVSLILEEGVTTSNSAMFLGVNNENGLSERCSKVPIQLALNSSNLSTDDAIPRDPPSSRLSPGTTSYRSPTSTNLLAYDPNRYQSSVRKSPQKSDTVLTPKEIGAEYQHTLDRIEQSSRTNEKPKKTNNPMALQSLLAGLPAPQLKRLEQMITTILNQQSDRNVPSQLSCSSEIPKIHTKDQSIAIQAVQVKDCVEVGVNTTQMYFSPPNGPQHFCTPNPRVVDSSQNGAMKTDPNCNLNSGPTLSDSSLRMGNPQSELVPELIPINPGRKEDHHEESPQDVLLAPENMQNGYDPADSSCPIISAAPNVEGGNDVRPNFANPEARRYSNLLASIQGILHRYPRGRQKDTQSYDHPRVDTYDSQRASCPAVNLNSEVQPHAVDHLCSSNPRAHSALGARVNEADNACSNEDCRGLFPSPFGSRPGNSCFNDALCEREQTGSGNSKPDGVKMKHTHSPNASQITNNIGHGYTPTSSLFSTELGTYDSLSFRPTTEGISSKEHAMRRSDVNASTTTYSQLSTDPDQSAFLASLVEKYLGIKTKRTAYHAKRTAKSEWFTQISTEHSRTDVTQFGGLNPTDLSIATREYLRRYGIIDTPHAAAKVYSSTPANCQRTVTLRQEQAKLERFFQAADDITYGPISRNAIQTNSNIEPSVASFSRNSIPNVLTGLSLDRTLIVNQFAGKTPSFHLPPSMDNTPSLSPLDTHAIPSSTLSEPNPPVITESEISCAPSLNGGKGYILDMERLRSLPKLL
ncbi:unnamed protein product [Calicophoron daubneyi]|uniref:STIL N-terminal domain-containing protein n=1 Tax=Calicophoron daubneyi TaxID=300641 RepID=A0AAV2TAW0_CALDB